MFRLIRRGLAARKLRTILTSIAIVLGVAMVAGTFVLTDQIDTAFDDIFSTALAGTDVVVSKQEAFESDFQQAGPLPESLVATIRGVDGVRKAEGSIEASGQIVVDGDVKGSIGGAPSFVFSHASEPFNPNEIVEGRFPERSGEIAIGADLSKDENVGIGDHVGLNTRLGEKPVTVVGTFKFGNVSSIGGASLVEVTLADAQQWFDREDQVSTISVQADEGVSQIELKRRIEAAVPADVKVQTRAEAFDEESADTTDAINGFLGPRCSRSRACRCSSAPSSSSTPSRSRSRSVRASSRCCARSAPAGARSCGGGRRGARDRRARLDPGHPRRLRVRRARHDALRRGRLRASRRRAPVLDATESSSRSSWAWS